MDEMWYGVALFFFMAIALAFLAWLNHRNFHTIFNLMDGRIEKALGGKDRRGGVMYEMQRYTATIVLSAFSLYFFWYFVRALGFLVFGWGS